MMSETANPNREQHGQEQLSNSFSRELFSCLNGERNLLRFNAKTFQTPVFKKNSSRTTSNMNTSQRLRAENLDVSLFANPDWAEKTWNVEKIS